MRFVEVQCGHFRIHMYRTFIFAVDGIGAKSTLMFTLSCWYLPAMDNDHRATRTLNCATCLGWQVATPESDHQWKSSMTYCYQHLRYHVKRELQPCCFLGWEALPFCRKPFFSLLANCDNIMATAHSVAPAPIEQS